MRLKGRGGAGAPPALRPAEGGRAPASGVAGGGARPRGRRGGDDEVAAGAIRARRGWFQRRKSRRCVKGPQEGPRGQALPMNTPGARRREKLGPRLGRPALPPPDRRKDGGAKAHAAGVSFWQLS